MDAFANHLTLGMQHCGLKLYKDSSLSDCINNELGLTLTYFMARSNLFANVFYMKKIVTKSFDGRNLQQMINSLNSCF